MVSKVARRARVVGLALCALFIASRADAGRDLYNHGLRWIGLAQSCVAPAGWAAARAFTTAGLPSELAGLCSYRWLGGNPPSPTQIEELAAMTEQLTEDVAVVYPSGAFSPQELGLLAGLRDAFRNRVGSVALAPKLAAQPRVRIAVLDTAPDAPHGSIVAGASRHGDTLAHLIEDLVCLPGTHTCAAEVTAVLAMPWIARNTRGSNGGYLGTLVDLAQAIDRAVALWQSDRKRAPQTTPPHLVLNLSLGWEDTPNIADCAQASPVGLPARAVQHMLRYATEQGALVIAAAGNDAGGPTPRTGLLCPGRYQALAQQSVPTQSLVIAVSGVDYSDRALATARPLGTTGIVGLGLGGVAWGVGDPAPPALTGSSVSTAAVSAVSALAWAAQPSAPSAAVIARVYGGGVALGVPGDACPRSYDGCKQRRASTCGALIASGVALSCSAPPPLATSSPALPASAALAASYAGVAVSTGTVLEALDHALPRWLASTVQTEPSTFPMPISETCPTCAVLAIGGAPYATLPARDQALASPVLVVELHSGETLGLALGASLATDAAYAFALPSNWSVDAAYLTGYEPGGTSLTEQIYVAP